MRNVIVFYFCFIAVAPAQAQYGGGTGEPNDPYQIWTAGQMNEIGLHPEDWDKHFILEADIDLSVYPSQNYSIIGRQVTIQEPYGIALDVSNQRIYWTDAGMNRLRSIKTDTTQIDDLVIKNSRDPVAVALDLPAGKVYWTEESYSPKIRRANLDGTEVEDLVTTGLSYPRGLALDLISRKMYWTDQGTRKIKCANLNGSDINDITPSGIVSPSGLALDVTNSKIYWIDYGPDKIQRADLDGTNVEDLVTEGLITPRGLSLDLVNKKMYWNDGGTDKIQRSDLDGNNIEDLITSGLNNPIDITLDLINGKMYWTDAGTQKIQRANLDGTDIEDLLPLPPFTGSFEGNGHAISNFTYIKPGADYIGIFETISTPAEINNVNLINPYIDVGWGRMIGTLVGFRTGIGTISNCSVINAYVNGGEYVGGLTGSNYGTLKNCQVSGSISGTLYTGGLVGYISSTSSEILDCSFTGNVQGGSQTGGIAGYNYGSIEQCYADATIDGITQTGGLVGYLTTLSSGEGLRNSFFMGDVNGTDYVGGLVGRQPGKIYSCYSDANVIGVSKVGGLTGESTGPISGSYSVGIVSGSDYLGGLVGSGSGENVYKSFWDINTSGILTSAGGIGLTTPEMQNASTYDVIWSCELAQWTIDDGNDYPRLLWENRPGELIKRYPYGGGSGTSNDPYLISSAEQINTIALLSCDWMKHFKLAADIDMMELGDVNFNSIDSFHGVFDGNGHTISNLILTNNSMFGTIYFSGVVKDLCLKNVYVDANGTQYCAGLASSNSGLIYACCCDADIVNGGNYISGLVGYNGYGSIVDCYTTGYVEGQNYISGLVGRNRGLIRRCYSATQITGSQYTGGLVGYNESQAMIDSSFWDVDVSGEPNGIGSGEAGDVTGKTTAEMQDSGTFLNADWDFIGETTNGPSDIWAEIPGNNYMVLWWQLDPKKLPNLPSFSGGSGTYQNPFLISIADDICMIGHNPRLMDAHYLLIADVNLAGLDFHQIGNEAYQFNGIFDGNGYEVANLSMQHILEDYVGFFGYTDSNCIIRNLGLVDANITTERCQYVGGIVGLATNTIITDSYFSGIASGSRIHSGSVGIGGLLGRSEGSTLQRCFSEGVVLAMGSYSNAGGLVYSFYDSNALNCFSTMSVTSYEQSGGLFSYCGSSRVENCYAAGPVEATYYNGEEGGLVGYYYDSEYKNCFWDINTTGRSNATGNSTVVIGSGKTTAEMLTAITFTDAGWDFLNTWNVVENISYPYLRGLPGPKPFKAHSFVPENGSDYIGIDVEICFESGIGATSHNIYFGTSNPPPFIRNQTELSYSPGLLENYTTYYWRIDEVGLFGITEGDTLSFKTGAWLGSGVEGDPFLIQNAADLLKVSIDPNAANAHFELSAHIDMDQLPSGIYEPFGFRGVLDGKGHSIFNFHHSENGNEVGFFSIISGIVRNVTLINPFVDGGSGDKVGALAGSLSRSANIDNCHIENAVVSGNNYVGGLAGYAGDYGMYDKWAAPVSNCSSSGVVTGNDYVGGISGVGRATNTHSSCIVSGTNYIGGLIGYGVSIVSNCRAEGAVVGNDYVGGLIGRTFDFSSPITSVENSCATGNVTGQTMVGGLIGYQPERISNCYARGDVYGVTNVGGLCGWCARLMLNCYSTGEVTGTTDAGGLVGGSASPPYFNCFWDIETSEQASSAAGRGKTTELMKSEITYAGFGCDEVWTIDDGNDYPYLLWENKPGQLITKPTYGGGSGQPNDPYLIYTPEQMSIIGLVLCDYDKHFKLMADIDMSYYDGIDGRPNHNIPGAVYMEGGTGRSLPFSGVFDGCHHTISNLKLKGTGEKCVGCFGYVGDGDYTEVKNLGVVNPNIVDTSLTNDKAIGSLVGLLRYGRVSNCYVLGGSIYVTATSQYTQDAHAGGLVGMNGYNGSIIRSFSSCSVSGAGQWCNVGGFVGTNWRAAKILDSYSNSIVNGDVSGGGYYYSTGGLVGENYEGTIRNCYSTGPVRHVSKPGNGLVGFNDEGIVENSFWDIESSDCTYSYGGTGLVTAQMQTAATFLGAGWDFINEIDNGVEDIWRLCNTGAEYPQLNWRFAGGDIVCPDGVDARDLSTLCEQWLLEKLTCDVDFQRDWEIDFLDFSIFAAAWQSTPSSPKWNPKCDIAPEAGDEKVDIKDMAEFIEQWLKTGSYYLNADVAPVPGGDDTVNMFDFAAFAENWLVGIE